MTITLTPNLAEVLNGFAVQRGTTVEALAVEALTQRFGTVVPPIPRDDWERRILSIGVDTGVPITDIEARNRALSSEGLYE